MSSSSLAADDISRFMAAVAAGEMMLLLLLRIGGFATIATIWWLLRCAGNAGRKALRPYIKPYKHDRRFAAGTGDHLEEHFVTLSQCWR